MVSQPDITRMWRDLSMYRTHWMGEVPLRIHSRDTGNDGAPAWHKDFSRYLFASEMDDNRWRDHSDHRIRTTRAFRRLRKHNPREYEVLYRVCVLGNPILDTMLWLNQRAIAGNHPERYSENDVIWYLVVATDKVNSWW